MVVLADFFHKVGVAFFGFSLCHMKIVPCNEREGKTFLTVCNNALRWRHARESGQSV